MEGSMDSLASESQVTRERLRVWWGFLLRGEIDDKGFGGETSMAFFVSECFAAAVLADCSRGDDGEAAGVSEEHESTIPQTSKPAMQWKMSDFWHKSCKSCCFFWLVKVGVPYPIILLTATAKKRIEQVLFQIKNKLLQNARIFKWLHDGTFVQKGQWSPACCWWYFFAILCIGRAFHISTQNRFQIVVWTSDAWVCL